MLGGNLGSLLYGDVFVMLGMKSVYLVFCFTISPPLLTFSRIIMYIQMRLFSSRTTGWKELLYNIINGTTTCNNDGFGHEIS